MHMSGINTIAISFTYLIRKVSKRVGDFLRPGLDHHHGFEANLKLVSKCMTLRLYLAH